MELQSKESPQVEAVSCNDVNHPSDDSNLYISNNGGTESMCQASEEEIRGIMEVIASTGKFWHEWDKLKYMLSFQLKQVLSEYPEARMSDEQQISALGETFLHLMKRLNEALLSFIGGPPFTLQRLCEIILDPQSIYLNLSKLALALEKNLLVASTLSISTGPYPPTVLQSHNTDGKEEPQPESNAMENGSGEASGDGDEIMTEVEAADDDNMTIDMETFEEIVGSSDTNDVPPTSSSSESPDTIPALPVGTSPESPDTSPVPPTSSELGSLDTNPSTA